MCKAPFKEEQPGGWKGFGPELVSLKNFDRLQLCKFRLKKDDDSIQLMIQFDTICIWEMFFLESEVVLLELNNWLNNLQWIILQGWNELI